MHQCLSCNQPCSLLSAFCDTCRASLLARRDLPVPEEQVDMVRAGGRSEGEGGYGGWERGEISADLTIFPQPDAPPVGAQPASMRADPPALEGENGAWTFETAGIYAMETVNDLDGTGEESQARSAGAAQSTHVLAVPLRPWQRMPKKVRRALLVFCIVGTVALLTDGILLALSLTHHRGLANTPIPQSSWDKQVVGSPVSGATLTPTMVVPLSNFALSVEHVTFNATAGQASLAPQTVTLSGLNQGATWRIEPANGGAPAWLHLSAWQGNGTTNSPIPVTVSVRLANLAPGLYTASMQVRAFDAQNKPLTGSPQALAVTLTVHPPCELSIAPERLSFGSVLGSVPAPQTLTLSASSACALPLSWQASSDAPWLTLSHAAGTLSASGGALVVQASTAGKLIGSYSAHITLRGTDGSGLGFAVTPATVSVTLTVLA